jgi:hypothetical protein
MNQFFEWNSDALRMICLLQLALFLVANLVVAASPTDPYANTRFEFLSYEFQGKDYLAGASCESLVKEAERIAILTAAKMKLTLKDCQPVASDAEREHLQTLIKREYDSSIYRASKLSIPYEPKLKFRLPLAGLLQGRFASLLHKGSKIIPSMFYSGGGPDCSSTAEYLSGIRSSPLNRPEYQCLWVEKNPLCQEVAQPLPGDIVSYRHGSHLAIYVSEEITLSKNGGTDYILPRLQDSKQVEFIYLEGREPMKPEWAQAYWSEYFEKHPDLLGPGKVYEQRPTDYVYKRYFRCKKDPEKKDLLKAEDLPETDSTTKKAH